jgi:hypothetical protein
MDVEKFTSKIDSLVTNVTNKINSKTTVEDLIKYNEHLQALVNLKNTVVSLYGYVDQEDECDLNQDDDFDWGEGEASEEPDEDFFLTFLEACHIIVAMYSLLDDYKVKEAKADWIFDDAKILLEGSRRLYGSRVPFLPGMRLVSKSRKVRS